LLATAEVNLPAMIRAVALIFPKALKMSIKKIHSKAAIPLCASLLCISSRDLFSKNWSLVVDVLVQKFRDKRDHQVVVTALNRLVWVYLFRDGGEGSDVGTRRMEGVLRGIFPSNRRSIVPGKYLGFLNNRRV
jgi:hypothetical protein